MTALTKRIVESYGRLIEVLEVERPGAFALVALGLRFNGGAVVIRAVAEDDTIALEAHPTVTGKSVGHELPWQDALGRGLIFMWTLTNQTGHEDGCQMEFGKVRYDGRFPDAAHLLTIQFMVAASALHISYVTEWPSGP